MSKQEADWLLEIDARISAMTTKQRKAAIRKMKNSPDPWMTIPNTVEWICLVRNVKAQKALEMVRAKLAMQELKTKWAD